MPIDSALSLAIIENAEDAIIVKSLDGTVTAWNAGAARLFGYTAAEMIGGAITRLFPPDRLHEEGELIARMVLGQTISHFVTRRVRKDGAHIDVSATLSPVRDASGTIVAVSTIARDVTETQQRHLAFALAAAIIEHSDDAIISKSTDGTVITWNSGAARIFGYTAAEMIGGPITRLFPADRLHEESELIAQLTHGKKISHFVTQRVRKNGSPIDVSVTLSPVRDASGKIVAISKIARDITEAYQKQLASALATAIVEHSDDAIISKTLDGTVISWNLGAEKLFGYTAMEMIGGPITRLFPDDRLTEEPELITKVVFGKTVDRFATRRLHKDGTSIDVSLSLSPVRNVNGQIVAVSKVARDISPARQRHIQHDSIAFIRPIVAVPKPTAQSERSLGTETDAKARANRALSEKIDELVRNEQRFQSLVQLTSQVIWTNSPEGRMEGAQSGWSAFTGQTFDEYEGFGWSAAVHPEDARPTIEEWTRCVADRRPFRFEHRVRRHDGAYRTCTINATPVLNDDGSIREWVGVHNDITERRQQEDEIRAQEAKFRFLTESLPQIVWTSRPDGWLDYFNQRWFDYTGLTLEHAQGWGWGPVMHPDDLRKIILLWERSVKTGEPLETECRFRRASDATYRWHLNRAVPFRDANGAIVKWFGTSTDIHDYKEAETRNLALQAELEDRVQQRTAELERVGKIAGVGGWSITVASSQVNWSDETCRILEVELGHQPTFEEAIGMYVPDSRDVIQSACRNCIANSVSFDLELQLTTAKGRGTWVRAVGEAQMERGIVVRIFGALQDITTRKQAELGLTHTSALLRRVLDSAGDLSIIATTPDLTISVFNKGAEQLLGYAGAELIDSATPMAIHDPTEVEARGLELSALLGRSVQGGSVFTEQTTLDVPREWTYITRDKRRVPVVLNCSAMFDSSGNLSGYLGVARDITQDREQDRSLQEAKSEAERANAAKSEFLANMSHEIRTPLNAVIGLGYLLEQTPLNEEQRSFLQKINFAGRSLLSVIDNVLDLSKIEAGEMLVEDADFDLNHLVQGIGQMLAPSAHAKGLALRVHCAADVPSRVRGDATRLGQIATNLLNNAIKFTETGQVELNLSCSKANAVGTSLRLSVRDTGIGIGPEGLARLFRPFSQADTSTTRRFGGTGLGLSISRRIVDLMGGQIGVTSTQGVGSEFWIEVPLGVADAADPRIDRAPLATPANSVGTRWLSGTKILVVDDSDINCEVAQHILRGQGAIVSTSCTGAQALERLRQDPDAFEIVLMDIQMPDMDGNEAARRIRTELRLKKLPIIALTAGALLSERERSLQAGMNDFLTKPFEPAALIGIVLRYLERKPIASLPNAPIEHAVGPALFASASSQVDSTVAQNVLGGNTALLISLLARLVQDFTEFTLPISVELQDAAALTHIKSRLHKLGGGAGMIGATTVHRLAQAAEAALAAGQAPEMVGALLRQLATALTALGEELVPMLAATAVNPVATCQVAAPIFALTESINRLLELLDDQNMDAIENLSAMSPWLKARLGEPRFAHLQEAVESLDFAMAATLIRDCSESATSDDQGTNRSSCA